MQPAEIFLTLQIWVNGYMEVVKLQDVLDMACQMCHFLKNSVWNDPKLIKNGRFLLIHKLMLDLTEGKVELAKC